MDKSIDSVEAAVADIEDGAVVMIAGFGGSGIPVELLHALVARFRATGHPTGLTVVNNNAGTGAVGIAAMLDAGMIAKVICSFPRSSQPQAFQRRYEAGEVELELVPQGTLAERIRAGGAGIPAFYTATGVGTELAAGKPVETFDGRDYLRERWLKADVALVKGALGDRHGNLTYRLAARNFAPITAMAATTTIAQVTRLVEPGEIEPEQVVTPGIFVQGVVEVPEPAQEEALIRAGEVA